MKKKSNILKSSSLVLIAVLLLAIIFRFYNFSSWVFFSDNQEYYALILKNIVAEKHFYSIAPILDKTGTFFAGTFIYFAAIPYLLFSGNPQGLSLVASIIGITVCYLIYKVGKEMFSQNVGLFASLFYGASFLIAYYDRQFWSLTLVPLISLLIGFFLFQILRNETKKLLGLSVVYGLAYHIHFSLLIISPLIIYVIWKKRRAISKKVLTFSLLIFILLQVPFLIFELRHNFANSRAVLSSITAREKQRNFSTLADRNTIFLSAMGRFFWVPLAPDLFLESGVCQELIKFKKNAYPEGIAAVLTGLIIFVWWYLHRQKNSMFEENRFSFTYSSKIITTIFLLTLLFILFYRQTFFEYYLLFFFPWLAIALGKAIDFVYKRQHGRIIVLPILLIFVVLNLATLLTSSFSYSYKDKLEAINFAKKYTLGKEYAFKTLGECQRGGFRFLFERLVGIPVDSQASVVVLFSLIDSRSTADTIAKLEEVKFRFLTEFNTLAEKRLGKIQVLILTPKISPKT